VRCGECDHDLSAVAEVDPRVECPQCGAKRRIYSATLTATVVASDYLAGTVKRDGDVIGFTESMLEGSAASSHTDEEGSIARSVLGRPPQNEDRALRSCEYLIEYLNSQAANWSRPQLHQERNSDIDCFAVHAETGRTLQMQVVRAESASAFWGELAAEGSLSVNQKPKDAAIGIRMAIGKKERLPRAQRGQLVLVLDATLTPDLIHTAVVRAARELLAKEAALGFQAIYLVGPGQQHVHRLDQTDETW
jgi:hypothetical protein